MIKQLILPLTILSLCGAAQAEEPSKYYVEAAYGAIRYDEASAYATPGVGTLRFGVNFDKNISAEFLVGTTITDARFFVGATPVTVKYDSIYGAYLKAKTEVAPNLDLFARLGFMHASISASVPGASASAGGSDISYGVGAQFNFNQSMYGLVDYMSYYSKNGATAKGPSIGLGVKF
jgi:hypothetical protein